MLGNGTMTTFMGNYEKKLDHGRLWMHDIYSGPERMKVFTNEFLDAEVNAGIKYVFICPLSEYAGFAQYTKEVIEVTTDDKGRVFIPSNMRSYAGIDTDSVLIGTGEVMELWERSAYEQYRTREDLKAKAELSKN